MGYEYEVYVWLDGQYNPYWQGESLAEALTEMEKASQDGYGCIKLEWRPTGKPEGGSE